MEIMSHMWEMRSRLCAEKLERLAEWLIGDAPKSAAELEEHTVLLLIVSITLLRQHQVNKRGRCQFCDRTRSICRAWRSRRRRTVHQALNFGIYQGLDVVWWCVLENLGRQ
ncbi:MAG TPA: hypothetical protein VFO16_04790 [Pseudonocardiaceae bacterium]|nr:hypothetical protein [Pseudonocardiaceae bacterium]